jgi:hypothetical protein
MFIAVHLKRMILAFFYPLMFYGMTRVLSMTKYHTKFSPFYDMILHLM